MTGNSLKTPQLAELEQVLDICGANPRRWPESVRSGLLKLIAQDPAAERMVREARSLEALLDRAPALSTQKCAALVERISAEAERQPRLVASGVVAGAVDRAHSQQTGVLPAAPPRRPVRESIWAGAAVAASLVLGIAIGQSQMAEPAAQILLQSADAVTDDESLQLALFDDGDVFLDEDLL